MVHTQKNVTDSKEQGSKTKNIICSIVAFECVYVTWKVEWMQWKISGWLLYLINIIMNGCVSTKIK